MKVFKVLYACQYASTVVEVSKAEATPLNLFFSPAKILLSSQWIDYSKIHIPYFCKTSSPYIKASPLKFAPAISE